MTKLTSRTAITTIATTDLIHVVDVSDTTDSASGTSKKSTISQLLSYIFSTATAITAHAGGGQANATELTAHDNEVTTVATSNDSVKLLAATQHLRQTVRNTSANDLDIYPQSGENFNGLAANAPYTLSGGGIVTFVCFTSGEWK
jgi:hypothetical protein